MIQHPFEAIYNENSHILILGSFPSVKSREEQFFYGHPQNRFWKILAAIYDKKIPSSIEEKKSLLIDNGIALWDVIASCDIQGSSDSSIENVIPNDLSKIFKKGKIEKVFCNGNKSYQLYLKYSFPKTKIAAVKLPSTSPANASWNLQKLIEEWRSNLIE